jgi:putative solute:sodium symporter small subunit
VWRDGGDTATGRVTFKRGSRMAQVTEKMREYWKRNLVITTVIMVIWFVVTYVVAFFAPELNNIRFIGFPLGFYMGAQGALIVYVVLIFYYAFKMNKLDREYGVHEEG